MCPFCWWLPRNGLPEITALLEEQRKDREVKRVNDDQFVVPFSPQTIKNLEGMSIDTDLQRIFQCFILKILLNKIH